MNAIEMKPVLIIARHELRIILRNRWVALYAAVFAILTLAVSYFGLAVIQFTGFQGFERTSVSLLNLVLYIVPLGSMLMGVQSFTKEGGATDQLFTEPVTRAEIVLGKIIGVSFAGFIALTAGFGFAGALIAAKVGTYGLEDYVALAGMAFILSVVFVAIAALIAILHRRSVKAYATILAVWFFLVIFFDLGVIGVTFLLPEGYANKTAFTALFLNPVDGGRVAALLVIAGKEVLGAAGAELLRLIGGAGKGVALLLASLVAWTIVPAIVSVKVLERQDV